MNKVLANRHALSDPLLFARRFLTGWRLAAFLVSLITLIPLLVVLFSLFSPEPGAGD